MAGRKREKSVTFRASEEELAVLKRLSTERELPMSIVLRQLLRKEITVPTHVTSEDTPPKREA